MSPRWIWIAVVVAAAACEKQAPPAAAPPADDATVAAVALDAASADALEAPPPDAAEAPAAEGADAAPAAAPPGKPAGKPPVDAAADAAEPAGGKANEKPLAKPPSAGGKGSCGGIAGFRCEKGQKCRYGKSLFKPAYPDAMGSCVAETYCDGPKDCEGLIHPMVVGAWACQKTACAWKAEVGGPQ
jgi:hypothetical protein